MAKKRVIIWRKATEEEIEQGLDNENPGSVIASSEWKEVPDEELSEDELKYYNENFNK